MSDEYRVDRIHHVIDLYEKLIGDEDERSLLIDLLTDLRHWCRRQEHLVDFGNILDMSEVNFNAEVE